MCIMTDSMTGWPATPAHAQHDTHGDVPSTPQKGKREKERQRHGDTATTCTPDARLLHLPTVSDRDGHQHEEREKNAK